MNESSAPSAAPPTLELALVVRPRICLAMQQSGLAPVASLRVRNLGERPLRAVELTLTFEPEVAEPVTIRLEGLAPGEAHDVREPAVRLRPGLLSERTERTAGLVQLAAHAEVVPPPDARRDAAPDVAQARTRASFEILSPAEWPGGSAPLELLAAFVQPNDPGTAHLLRAAADLLESWTGNPTLDGYQSRDPERVRRVVAAIYGALQRLDVTYVVAPASFEEQGQKVRSPSRLLSERMGNCLDVSLACAAAMEQAGVRPLLFVIRGHAFVGAWLHEDALATVVDEEPRRFLSLLDLGSIVVFEATAATSRPRVSFERAEAMARAFLDDTARFHAGVDVAMARRQRVLPLASPAEHEHRLAAMPLSHRAEAATDAPGSERRLAVRLRAEASAAADGENAGVASGADRRGGGSARAPIDAHAARRLDVWRARLLDLSLRNRLLSHRDSQRWIGLAADAVELDAALARASSLQIVPQLARGREGADDPDTLRAIVRDELAGGRAVADLAPSELAKRGTGLYRLARVSHEEGGASALFVALGFLVWFESASSSVERLAPVLLRPATLTRETGSERVRMASADEECFLNPSLVEKLRADFGVDLSALQELPRAEDGRVDIELALHRVREAVRAHPRWIVREQSGVGLFTFAKFLMYNDLVARVDEILANPVARSIVEGVPIPGAQRTDMPTPDNVEEHLPPQATFCPMDADASQLSAVAAAVAGASFVIQGPPGTGKSQTITNMIAQLLAEGRRVLFVSEKMAALEVVHRRLAAVGLGPFCLELHSRDMSRKAVLEQFAEPLALADSRTETGWKAHADRLATRRTHLDTYAHEIGRVRAAGLSVFDALGRMMRLRDAPWVDLGWSESADSITTDRLRTLEETADRWEAAVRDTGLTTAHPLRDIEHLWWSPTLPGSLGSMTGELRASVDRLGAVWNTLAERTDPSLPRARPVAELLVRIAELCEAPLVPASLVSAEPWDDVRGAVERLVGLGRTREQAWGALAPRWTPGVLAKDPGPWIEVLRRPWWWLLLLVTLVAWFRTRSEVRALARAPEALSSSEACAADLEVAGSVRGLDEQLRVAGAPLAGALGWLWAGETTDWERMAAALDTAERARALRREAYGLGGSAGSALAALVTTLVTESERREALGSELRAFVEAWRSVEAGREAVSGTVRWREEGASDGVEAHRAALDALAKASPAELRAWAFQCDARRQMVEAGLAAVVTRVEQGDVAPSRIRDVFDASFARWWSGDLMERTPVLRGFNRLDHERRIQSFQELDRASIELAREEVRARLAGRIPSASAPRAQGSELSVLLRELQKQRGHMPLRRLMMSIPTLIPVLKPCFLMSPLSIAQHVDPAMEAFDVVIFDEASQIPSSDAIAALGRGRQAIVVGDTRQLPPTSFFQRSDEDEFSDEADYQELESILNECLASGLPEIYLRWHYRSNDESLIAFSNAQYYDHRLVTFPSPAASSPDQGVRLLRVDGVYARGGSRDNRVEAEVVVAEVVRRLRDPELSKESIGVITFSLPQQTLIEDLLDKERARHPELEPFFTDGRHEPVFVKNLENVQGDERETILFSICYGPDEHGRLSMNFGPLNRQGGERRLNVAVTRARTRLLVYSSLDPERIDLRRTGAVGVAHLKQFLHYAADGARALGVASVGGRTFDSPFEKQVCDALRVRGWDVDTQVGCSGYRIDLAVRHPDRPGRWVLGIECDGATYHSSRSARERDRLRQQILEQKMGWRLHRIWSTDWWIDPVGETERAVQAIRDAIRDGQAARADASALDPPPGSGTSAGNAAAEEGEADGAEGGGRAWDDEPTNPQGAARAATPPTSGEVSGGGQATAAPRALVREEVLRRFEQAPSIGEAPSALEGASAYRVADVGVRGGGTDAWRALPRAERVALVRAIVAVEAPIRIRPLARRVGQLFDIGRISGVFVQEVEATTEEAGLHVDAERFVWSHASHPAGLAGFRYAGAERERDLDAVAVEEIVQAMRAVLGRAGSIERDELFRETLRVFGYASLGAQLRERLEHALQRGVASGRLEEQGGRVARADG